MVEQSGNVHNHTDVDLPPSYEDVLAQDANNLNRDGPFHHVGATGRTDTACNDTGNLQRTYVHNIGIIKTNTTHSVASRINSGNRCRKILFCTIFSIILYIILPLLTYCFFSGVCTPGPITKEIEGCTIKSNAQNTRADASFMRVKSKTFSCVTQSVKGGNSSLYEIHVLGVYESVSGKSSLFKTGTCNVTFRGKPRKPVILGLSNYQPVRWILYMNHNINIHQIYLFSYKWNLTSVVSHGGESLSNVTHVVKNMYGYGNKDNGRTDSIVKYLSKHKGLVSSFTGAYRADQWVLRVGS